MSKSISLPLLPQATGHKSAKNVSLYSEPPISLRDRGLTSRVSTDSTRNFLLKSRDRLKRGCMETYSGSIGPSAKLDFIHNYKYLKEISERNKYEKLELSPSAAYLEAIDKQKLNPVPFGIVRNNGKETEVDIHGYYMGDNYAKAFSEGFKHCKSIEKINLKSNRLSEKGTSLILSTLDFQNIKDLCLSDNKLGLLAIHKIRDVLIDSKSSLKHLSLESTGLNDQAGIIIFDSLLSNSSVTRLNLAKNNLTHICAKSLKISLSSNNTLRRLDLHWNHFTGGGCAHIFEGIAKNLVLVELDLSWNLMTRNLGDDDLQTISKALALQKSLRHLDLSSNYLTGESCKIISEGLTSNHSLLGIHMAGNDCTIDSRGFIIPNPYVSKVEQGHFMARIIGEKKIKKHSQINCWLCEGWIEIKFDFKGEAAEPVCIHLECDDYQPDLMVKEKDYYTITRVVPPGKVNFFFSVNLNFVKSQDFRIKKLPAPIEKNIYFWGDINVRLFISNLNQIDAQGFICNSKDPFRTEPRTPKLEYVPPPTEMEKIPWSIPISLFKDYKIDDEDLLNECFEFDWKHCRIPNLIKDPKELELTKSYLREIYQTIKESFKTLSAYSGSEVPCIGSNAFIELLGQCNIFDNLYAISDFGVNWNSAVVQTMKGMTYNPANALVRYEFMELIVRVGYDRYIRTKTLNSANEAVCKIFNDHLLPKLTTLCAYKWRTEEYMCEIVDVVLKSHKPMLDSIYKKYSGRKALPGQKPFVSLKEFRDLCQVAGLVNDFFSTREIDWCYFQAMMTQVDELYKKRHLEMSYTEFLEALCRACNLASVNPITGDQLELQPHNMTLQNKIENAAHLLIKVCPQSVQETFVFPTTQTYEKLMYRPKGVARKLTTMNVLDN